VRRSADIDREQAVDYFAQHEPGGQWLVRRRLVQPECDQRVQADRPDHGEGAPRNERP